MFKFHLKQKKNSTTNVEDCAAIFLANTQAVFLPMNNFSKLKLSNLTSQKGAFTYCKHDVNSHTLNVEGPFCLILIEWLLLVRMDNWVLKVKEVCFFGSLLWLKELCYTQHRKETWCWNKRSQATVCVFAEIFLAETFLLTDKNVYIANPYAKIK